MTSPDPGRTAPAASPTASAASPGPTAASPTMTAAGLPPPPGRDLLAGRAVAEPMPVPAAAVITTTLPASRSCPGGGEPGWPLTAGAAGAGRAPARR